MTLRVYNPKKYEYEFPVGCPVELGDRWSFFVDYQNQDTTRVKLLYYRDMQGHEIEGYGVAYRHPDDNFSRATGRKTAFAKAIQHMTKDDRRHLWSLYHRRFPVKRTR